MKKKEFNQLREKDRKELTKMVLGKKSELEKVRMKMFGGKEKNLKVGRILRVEIAKILTLIREKEIIESLQPKEKKEEKVTEEKKK